MERIKLPHFLSYFNKDRSNHKKAKGIIPHKGKNVNTEKQKRPTPKGGSKGLDWIKRKQPQW
jgi:hypothetical protein